MQAARRLHRKRWRDREGAYLVEGPRAVAEALALPGMVRELFVVAEAPGTKELCAAAREAGVSVTTVTPPVMEAIASTTTPQGVAAVANAPGTRLDDLAPDASLVVVLAGVRDPGNAGTLVRSAAAVGADAVVFSRGAADPLQPKVVRAASGSLWRLPIVRGVPARDCLQRLRSRGLHIVGADAAAPVPVYAADLTAPVAIVLGNESGGLAQEARSLLDETVAVPIEARVESLNVAIAGSVILFEAARQRRAAGER